MFDVHHHVCPPPGALRSPAFARAGLTPVPGTEAITLVHEEGLSTPLAPALFDDRVRLEQMRRDQVGHALLSPIPNLFVYWRAAQDQAAVAAAVNDDTIARAEAFPDRLSAAATLPLGAPGLALEELNRIGQRVRAIVAGPSIEGSPLDDGDRLQILARIADARLPLLVHPYVLGARPDCEAAVEFPHQTGSAFAHLLMRDRLPEHLVVILVHGGGTAPWLMDRLDHYWMLAGRDGERLPSRRFRRQVYVDTLTHGPHGVHLLLDLVGPQRILAGTDTPFHVGQTMTGQRAAIETVGLHQLGENARRALQLSDERPSPCSHPTE